MNYWKQLTHVLKYFRAEEDPKSRLPANFIQGFLEVSHERRYVGITDANADFRAGIKCNENAISQMTCCEIAIEPCHRAICATVPYVQATS